MGRKYWSILLLVLLSSCHAKVKVLVDVFDKQALEETIQYKKSNANHMLDELNTSLSDYSIDELRNEFKDKAKDALETFFIKARKSGFIIDDKFVMAAQNSFMSKFDTPISKAKEFYTASRIRLISYKQKCEDEHLLNSALQYKLLGDNELLKCDSLIVGLFDELNNAIQNSSVNKGISEKVVKANFLSFSESLKTETSDFVVTEILKTTSPFGESVVQDKLASIIVSAPNKYWRKYNRGVNIISEDLHSSKKSRIKKARVNKTAVSGFFGNLDVAIKMEEPGEFYVKGVRMDADAALQASSRVVNQAVKYFSAGALGNTVEGVAGNAVGTVNDVVNKGLTQADLNQLKSKTDENTRDLISALLNKQNEFEDENDPQKRKEILDQMQTLLNNYKSQLNELVKK